jgi:ribonuclease E
VQDGEADDLLKDSSSSNSEPVAKKEVKNDKPVEVAVTDKKKPATKVSDSEEGSVNLDEDDDDDDEDVGDVNLDDDDEDGSSNMSAGKKAKMLEEMMKKDDDDEDEDDDDDSDIDDDGGDDNGSQDSDSVLGEDIANRSLNAEDEDELVVCDNMNYLKYVSDRFN